MTVGELIKELNQYDKNLEVILQKDAEGNGYHNSYGTGLAVDDENNNYPDAEDTEELEYIYDDEIPKERVVVIA